MPPKRKAAANGKTEIDPADYVPACVEACPSGAIHFGDLNDPSSETAQARTATEQFPPAGIAGHRSEDLLPVEEGLGREIASAPRPGKENARG